MEYGDITADDELVTEWSLISPVTLEDEPLVEEPERKGEESNSETSDSESGAETVKSQSRKSEELDENRLTDYESVKEINRNTIISGRKREDLVSSSETR